MAPKSGKSPLAQISCIRLLVLMIAGITIWSSAMGQRGFGLRFGSDFNHFFRAEQHPLVDGWWSNLVFGPYYQAYFDDGGAQVGLNILYKGNTGQGFPNFPVIQRDFKDDQNVGLTAVELDFKVGPRFGLINPKIGMLLSYWVKRDGFLEAGATDPLNNINFQFPIGVSIEGPTGYGSVGFSVFYEIGLTNVLKNPMPSGLEDWDGSKMRGLSFEMFILFQAGKQEAKVTPNRPKPFD